MDCRQGLPFSRAEPLQHWTLARHCSPGEPCVRVQGCVCVRVRVSFSVLMNECVCMCTVCVCVYAKLLCCNLMTQTHAERATVTGVDDSCIFDVMCVYAYSSACRRVCFVSMHAVSGHSRICFYAKVSSCLYACVCLRAGVLSRYSTLQIGQSFSSHPRPSSDRQPSFPFFWHIP